MQRPQVARQGKVAKSFITYPIFSSSSSSDYYTPSSSKVHQVRVPYDPFAAGSGSENSLDKSTEEDQDMRSSIMLPIFVPV